jgi:hypothetical protein
MPIGTQCEKSYVLARLRHDPNAAIKSEGYSGCGGSKMSAYGLYGYDRSQEDVPQERFGRVGVLRALRTGASVCELALWTHTDIMLFKSKRKRCEG